MGARESTPGKATVIDNVYRSVLLCKLAGLSFAETKNVIYSIYGRIVSRDTLKDWYYGRYKHSLSRLNSLDKSLFYHKAYRIAMEIRKRHPEWGYKRVATETNKKLPVNVPATTVYFWITGRSKPNVTPVRVVPELGYLTGVLVGDYKRTDGGLQVKNKGFIEHYIKTYEKVTGIKLKIHKRKDKYYKDPIYYTKENGGFMKTLWKTGLWKTIAMIYKKDFLQGLFDSEGTIVLRTKSVNISFTTSTEEVLKIAKQILNDLGYRVKIENIKSEERELRGKSTKFKENYKLYIRNGIMILDKFSEEIGFRESIRKKKLEIIKKVIKLPQKYRMEYYKKYLEEI